MITIDDVRAIALVLPGVNEADEMIRDSWCLRTPARSVKEYLAALDPG